MSFARMTRLATALVAAVAVAACSDSTAPTIDQIDAQAAAAKVEPVMNVMDQPALASFGVLADFDELPGAAASAASLTAVGRLTSAAARGTWDRSAQLFARSAARSADVLPADVRGKIYTYNEATGQYEGTTSAEAPANGIRVVLYAVNPLTGQISSPLTPVGYVDLIDESNASQNRLSVILVSGSTTLMDYDITHSVTASSESFSIAGWATNGTTPVTFNLTGTENGTGATLTFDLAAQTVGFTVHVGANVSAVTGQATVETALGYDGHTLSFRLTLHENGMDGEIKFDGMRYATLTVTVERTGDTETVTTTFVKANGRPMTIEEVEQIGDLFERALDFGGFWAGLLWPLGALAPAV
jgi:hypothetical protein